MTSNSDTGYQAKGYCITDIELKDVIKLIYQLCYLGFSGFLWFLSSENIYKSKYNLYTKIHNLHCSDDGESSEKSHCAPNSRQNVSKLDCIIFCDSVKCWAVKIDSHKLECCIMLYI